MTPMMTRVQVLWLLILAGCNPGMEALPPVGERPAAPPDLGIPFRNVQFMAPGYELRVRTTPVNRCSVPQCQQLLVVWRDPFGEHLELTVESLKDLWCTDAATFGYVRIDTAAKALAYVRLTTGDDSIGRLLEWQGWEVLSGQVVSDAWALRDELANKYGLRPPIVRKDGEETWIVERTVARYAGAIWRIPSRIRVVRVRERVFRHGGYEVLSVKTEYEGPGRTSLQRKDDGGGAGASR